MQDSDWSQTGDSTYSTSDFNYIKFVHVYRGTPRDMVKDICKMTSMETVLQNSMMMWHFGWLTVALLLFIATVAKE